MGMICVNGTSLYYDDTGGSGAPVVFSHGLLWNVSLFSPQIAALRNSHRCIAYDHRGQGKSADGVGRSIDMDVLAADAAALIEALGLGPVHFCGLSMGGFVALRLAIHRPELIRSLVLLDTSADPEPLINKLRYRALNILTRLFGPKLTANQVMEVLFGKTTLTDYARASDRLAWREQLAMARPSIWRSVNGILERKGVYKMLGSVGAPTLVIVGTEDVATPPARAERIAGAIKGAKLVRIPRAGHSATVEQPDAVTKAIQGFLCEVDREIH
jgi:3-oxoadipate enol-lactonase